MAEPLGHHTTNFLTPKTSLPNASVFHDIHGRFSENPLTNQHILIREAFQPKKRGNLGNSPNRGGGAEGVVSQKI